MNDVRRFRNADEPLGPLKMVAGMVRYRPVNVFLMVVFAIVSNAVVPQATGLLTRSFFDGLSHARDVVLGPYSIAVLLIAVSIAQAATSIGHTFFDASLSLICGCLMRWNVLRRVLSRHAATALPVSVGEATNRLCVDPGPPIFVLRQSTHLVGSVIFATVAIITMLRIHVLITIVVFLPLACVAGLFRIAGNRIGRLYRANRKSAEQVTEHLEQTFEAIQSVKAAGAEDRMIREFRRRNEGRKRAELRTALFDNILHSTYQSIIQFGTGFILLLCGSALRSGSFTVGDFAIFTYYLGSAMGVSYRISSTLSWYKRAQISRKQLTELMGDVDPNELTSPARILHRKHIPGFVGSPPPPVPLDRLEIDNISCIHPGGNRGVHDISFHVDRGEFLVVTGRIGSGKTTLLRAIIGALPLDRGTILWNGEQISCSEFLVPPRCAYLPQSPRLLSDSIRNNILRGAEADDPALEHAAYLSGLEYDIERMEQGFDTVVGPRGVRLSGGQVQRTAAARTLIRPANLLLIDDLSSSLDVETEKTIWERLGSRRSDGTAWIVVSHRRPTLRMADRIIVLADGNIEAIGPLDSVLESSEEMRMLWAKKESDGSAVLNP